MFGVDEVVGVNGVVAVVRAVGVQICKCHLMEEKKKETK